MKTAKTKTEYHVKRSQDAWMVCEYLYDGSPKPRVTVITVHSTRHAAIDSARTLAGEAMYYVDDAPAPMHDDNWPIHSA
jgi:hypothetical protein